jgi:hypothetical protein
MLGLLHDTLTPTNSQQLCVCYLAWALVFIGTNVVWDIKSRLTPKFHFLSLQSKGALLHPAASLCSCILVIASLVDHSVHEMSEESAIPLILTSLSGILQAAGQQGVKFWWPLVQRHRG